MTFAQGCRQSVGKPQLPYVGSPSPRLLLNPEVWPTVAGVQHHKQYLTNSTPGRKQTHLPTNWLYPLSHLCWEKSHKPRFWRFVIDDMWVLQSQKAVNPGSSQHKVVGPT